MRLYRDEVSSHHVHGAEPAVLSIYCAVFTVFLYTVPSLVPVL